MKVLLNCGLYTDGEKNIASQFVHAQAIALKNQGIDVCLISLDMRSARKFRKLGIYKCNIDGIDVYVGSFPCGPIKGVLEKLSEIIIGRVYKKVVKQFGKPDIIHSHFYANANAIHSICKKENIKQVVTEHASWVLSQNRKEYTTKKAKIAYTNSDKIICVSNLLKRDISKFFGGEITVIPNIVSNNFCFKPLNSKNKEFTFISVGNLIKTKQMDVAIGAFKKFTEIQPNSKLVIVGKGILEKELKDLVKSLDLVDKVEFKGFIPNKILQDAYNKSHCFVLPSNFETFGVVYIEAMSCGLPVISISSTGFNEVVTDEDGIILKNNNVEDVFEGMVKIYSDYDYYVRENISKRALSKYNEKVIADKLITIYDNI